ncbi:hypothetical protein Pcinc_038833 [Petrolisthes cinctipes]|uniref:Protein-lysine N-methyltransferase Pcinc_038833 n=1 Tax=Petrolisthes cinctipes TaxID=88211 RepID=A0AAE1BKL7_PETCI|nr:hypothetical protein Pcinc_040918 [Petrolisthes cinctipes]KAK3854704.1 hypothetical protein Pcinc_038833 [Petrolisthes cinctipes]
MEAASEELPPSELGTKEYWDSVYGRELTYFSKHGDIGEVWFGEDCMERVVDWVLSSSQLEPHSSIVDVGCGNGAFLLYLAADGYTNLTGIDYSEKAIELARAVAEEKKYNVKYERVDLTSEENDIGIRGKTFDLCHDKGTYDAISLCPEDVQKKRSAYIKAIHHITKENGLFIITSCNWTHNELIQHFCKYFIKEHIIPSPTFMFGGKVGSSVSTVVFRKIQ